MQLAQAELPVEAENLPAAQFVQADPPSVYWPMAQETHAVAAVAPDDSVAVPAAQLAQAELPVEFEYVPSTQFVQADPPVAYCPMVQETHEDDAAAPTELVAVPAGQLVQMELPATVEYWPLGQLAQLIEGDAE